MGVGASFSHEAVLRLASRAYPDRHSGMWSGGAEPSNPCSDGGSRTPCGLDTERYHVSRAWVDAFNETTPIRAGRVGVSAGVRFRF